MINIALCGGYGRMGKEITELCLVDSEITISYIIDIKGSSLMADIGVAVRLSDIIDCVDLVVDFTPITSCLFNMKLAAEHKKPFITGTTGFSDKELVEIKKISKNAKIFHSNNFSLGVQILLKLLKTASGLVKNDYDIEIVEMHHNQKIDAPSGTALKIHETLMESYPDYNTIYGRKGQTGVRSKKEIAIHSLRGGDVVGDHKVIFSGNGERIEIEHKAISRKTFASGVVTAIKFMSTVKNDGLYGMDSLVR